MARPLLLSNMPDGYSEALVFNVVAVLSFILAAKFVVFTEHIQCSFSVVDRWLRYCTCANLRAGHGKSDCPFDNGGIFSQTTETKKLEGSIMPVWLVFTRFYALPLLSILSAISLTSGGGGGTTGYVAS